MPANALFDELPAQHVSFLKNTRLISSSQIFDDALPTADDDLLWPIISAIEHNKLQSQRSMIIDALPRLLNRTSFLVALISISWYCILVATGEYARWSYPVLIGAAICKLTSVAPTSSRRWQNHEDSNGSSSSSSFFNTHRQRLSSSCCCGGLLRSIYNSIAHRIPNDNHQNNLYILSTAIILLPCIIFYIRRVIRHLSKLTDDGHYNHDELANDFGKLSAASLSFLLLPAWHMDCITLGYGL
eukprot:scaffold5180_cov74-Skeletonema_marinoi.AAC.2